jgi:hypothetical protein
MRRSLVIALLLVFTHFTASTQQLSLSIDEVMNVAQLLPDEVEVVGSSQGMAIWRRYAFLMHDKGQCVVVDMRRGEYVNTFKMVGNTGHCNNASFGNEYYSRQSRFPLLYVTECRGERACYVNDISLEGSRLVQTIHYDGEEITGPSDWVVDSKQNRIYLYCTIGKMRMLKAFRLPRLSDSDENGEVHLRPEDSFASIPLGAIAIPQGSMIKGRYAYLPDGLPTRDRRLHIVDIVSCQKVANFDLNHIPYEPEGVASKGRKLFLSFHTPRDVRANRIYRFEVDGLE